MIWVVVEDEIAHVTPAIVTLIEEVIALFFNYS